MNSRPLSRRVTRPTTAVRPASAVSIVSVDGTALTSSYMLLAMPRATTSACWAYVADVRLQPGPHELTI